MVVISVELATAYISLVPSTKGIAGQLRKELGGPLTKVSTEAGKTSGRGFASNFVSQTSESVKGLGGAITGAVSKGLKVAGAAAGGAFIGSMVAGFGRLRAIDDARFKLQGLGHDAGMVDTIMKSALESVRGTAFGLGDAATIAAGAVAAGIKPGEELTRVLSLTGDAASIAGVGLDEMGSIFGKVAASNRMMTEEMNQLQDRGLPVLSWLQEELGATADEVREMVSKGEVDFATFTKIIEDNIGGAALTAGESFRGSLANVGAAIGRFGAALLGPVFEKGPGLFGRITEAVDGLTERVGPLAERFAVWLPQAFERVRAVVMPIVDQVRLGVSGFFSALSGEGVTSDGFVGVMERIGVQVRALIGWFHENRETVAAVGRAFAAAAPMLAGFAVGVSTLAKAWQILRVATPVGLLLSVTTALVYAWQNSERFRQVVTGAFEAVRGAIAPVAQWFQGVRDAVVGAFSGSGSGSGAVAEFRGVIERLGPVVSDTLGSIRTIVETVMGWLSTFWRQHGDGLLGYWRKTFSNILSYLEGTFKVIQGILKFFAGLFTGDWRKMGDGLRLIWDGLWKTVMAIFNQAKNALGMAMRLLRSALTSIVSAIRDRVVALFGNVRDWVADRISTMRDRVVSIFRDARDKLRNAAAEARDWVAERFETLKDKAIGWVQDLLDFVIDLPNKIKRGLGDLGSTLLSAGEDLIGGLIEGASNFIAKIPEKIADAVKGIGSGILNAIGKLNPFAGDGPGNIRAAGKAVDRARAAATGLPVRMTNSYRSPAHNRRVGGSPTSYHLDKANPASDWVGPTWALDEMARRLRRAGGYRELLWRVPNHAPGDNPHLHYAHTGGLVTPQGIVPLRNDELLTALQVGEVVVPAPLVGAATAGRGVEVTINAATTDAHALAREAAFALRMVS